MVMNWKILKKESLMDTDTLRLEYQKENKLNEYQPLLDKYLSKKKQKELKEGESPIDTRTGDFENYKIAINIETDPVRTLFRIFHDTILFNSLLGIDDIPPDDIIRLKNNQELKKFTKLCFYIEEKYKNAQKNICTNNCIDPKKIKVLS